MPTLRLRAQKEEELQSNQEFLGKKPQMDRVPVELTHAVCNLNKVSFRSTFVCRVSGTLQDS